MVARGAEPLADGTGVGLRRLGLGPARAGDPLSVTDEATAERFKWSVIAPMEADRSMLDASDILGWLEAAAGTDPFMRLAVAGAVSARRLLGAHLPAASPERRETVAGECLGCQTQFAIDVRLPLAAVCPDCGAEVLLRADIEGPERSAGCHSPRPGCGRNDDSTLRRESHYCRS